MNQVDKCRSAGQAAVDWLIRACQGEFGRVVWRGGARIVLPEGRGFKTRCCRVAFAHGPQSHGQKLQLKRKGD